MRREISISFQTDKTAAQYIALAQLVDQYAFDVVSVYCDAPFHPSYGPLLLMAPHIKRARLGPAGVPPSRMPPIDIAAQAALLADLARAGTYLGIVRGGWLAEHGIAEIQPPLQAIRETIEIVRCLLAGNSGAYDGDIYRLAAHVRAPYPLPKADIPLLIGTWGPKLAALAGELADEVKIGGSANPDMIPVMQRHIAVGEQAAGRSAGAVGIVMGAVTVIDEDRAQARALARREVALYLPIVARLDHTLQVEAEMIDRVQQHVNNQDADAAARLISDDVLDLCAFAGNPDDIIQQSEALFAAGASRIEFGTPHGPNPVAGIRLLGEQVVPALKK